RKQGGKSSRKTLKTVVSSAEEKYFDVALDVVGTGNAKAILLPGHHQLPFSFKLPQGLPSSFVGKYGVVHYEIRAEIKRPGKKSVNAKTMFTVNGLVDLNTAPGVSQPMEVRKYKKLCCLFCKSGPIGFVLKLPRRGFVPGEYLHFVAELNNHSTRNVNSVKISLLQKITFKANEKSKFVTKTVCEAKGPAVGRGDSESWSGDILKIPPIPPSKLATCRIIDVEYTLHFEMDLAGPAINLRQDIPITIGSVPLQTSYNDIRTMQNTAPALSPSAPSQDLVDGPTMFLQDIYPDLPPPSYADAVFQDRFGAQGGDENKAFDGSSEVNITQVEPVTRPGSDTPRYMPKYVTYGK
ncbi:unnamed protein product, partial [Allacma fusca]